MLRALILENFKAFGGRRVIPIRPITLIFGPNSAGKSAILQSLLMLKQTAADPDSDEVPIRLRDSLVDLGTFREMVYQHDTERIVEVTPLLSDYPDISDRDWSTEWGANVLDDRATWGIGVRFKSLDDRQGLVLDSSPLYFGDSSAPFASLYPSSHQFDTANGRLGTESNSSDDVQRANDVNEPHTIRIEPGHELWTAAFRVFEDEGKPPLRGLLEESRSSDDAFWDVQNLADAVNASTEEIMAGIEKVLELTEEEYLRVIQSNVAYAPPNLRTFLIENIGGVQAKARDTFLFDPVVRAILGFVHGSLMQEPRFPGLSQMAMAISSRLESQLRDLLYLGPLRDLPERHYLFQGLQSSTVGASGQRTADILFSNSDLRRRVNETLERFDIQYELDVQGLLDEHHGDSGVYILRLIDRKSNVRVSIRDVGFGISQVLPVIVQAFLAEGRTILIEQPELHLHPRLQAELADVFIESALKQNNTFVIETHSEHLILRLMRRLRDSSRGTLPDGMPPLTPDDVSIIYVHPMEDGSGSVPLVMDLNEEGRLLTAWPRGFFEEGFDERFA